MSAAAGQSLRDQVSRPFEENEMNVFGSPAKDITISSLERRASDHDARTGSSVDAEPENQRAQPFGAGGGGERKAGRHLGDALLGGEFVSFPELDIAGVGERGSAQGLSRGGESHHHAKGG